MGMYHTFYCFRLVKMVKGRILSCTAVSQEIVGRLHTGANFSARLRAMGATRGQNNLSGDKSFITVCIPLKGCFCERESLTCAFGLWHVNASSVIKHKQFCAAKMLQSKFKG